MPKISVIIPSYNHEAFIGEAIESVLMQDFTDFELLIADDCSSDNSTEIIQSYQDERIKHFFLSENVGATKILKLLIENATSSYIALLNSDDRWCQGKLRKQFEFMESHPEYAACFTWANLIDENGVTINRYEEMDPNIFIVENKSRYEWLNWFFFHGNCLCHPSILIRKSIYEELGYYNGAYRQLPDFEYWVRICSKYEIYIIPEVLVNHRRTTGKTLNTSANSYSNINRHCSEIINILSMILIELDDNSFLNSFKNNFKNKNAFTKEELICERYFLLMNNSLSGNILKSQASQYFMNNYRNDAIASCFEDKYNYSLNDFYDDNLLPVKHYIIHILFKSIFHDKLPILVKRFIRTIYNAFYKSK